MLERFEVRRPLSSQLAAAGWVLLIAAVCWGLVQVSGSRIPFLLFVPAALLAAWYGGVTAGVIVIAAGYLLGDYALFHPPGAPEHHERGEVLLLLTYGLTTLGSVVLVDRLRHAHWRLHAAAREAQLRTQQLEREIREHRQAELTRMEAEAKYRTLVEESLVGVYLIQDGRFVYVNARLAAIFGYATQQEVVGRPVSDLVAPEDRPLVVERVRRREAGELHSIQYCFRGLRKDGGIVHVEVLGTATIYHGRPAVLGSLLDITPRMAAEAQLRQAKEAAEAANAAKDHFLAVLSHELRTPLTAVLPALGALEGLLPDDQGAEYVQMARRNVELEARLIDDLLDVTRISRGKVELDRQPVDLCAIVHRAAEVCQADIDARHLHFGIQSHGGPHLVSADAARLQQIFWNLIKNAVKFTPHDGCIGIRCYGCQGHASVEIADSGVGIEPQAIDRIFNAFEQADRATTRKFGGLGLGLAISKALVELHGGTLTARSEGKDRGSTFIVRLPAIAQAATLPLVQAPAPPAASAPPAAPPAPLRILFVEDHGDTARILRHLLGRAGHRVTHAGDVATALDLAMAETFDLLLSDLGLPDASGLELIRELRARGRALPAIALSGYGTDDDIARSHEAGFIEHLTKPVDFRRLQTAITRVTTGALSR